MKLSQEYMAGVSNRRVGVQVTYLSDLNKEELDDRISARANGRDVPLSKRHIKIENITANFMVALQEINRISKSAPAGHKDAVAEISMKTLVLQEMMRELLGDKMMTVGSLRHELDDIVPFGEDDLKSAQERVDQIVMQSRNPEWVKVVRKLNFSPEKMLNDMVMDAVDTTLNGKKALRLNFLTATAVGLNSRNLIDRALSMPRTKSYLLNWTGLDLPMISASIVHNPILSPEDIAYRSQSNKSSFRNGEGTSIYIN
jgi:hypothetical protein